MRIAVITHNIVKGDGQGRVNYEIIRHTAARGAKLTLIADRVAPELEQDPNIVWVKVQPKIRNNWLMHGLEFVARANRVLDDLQARDGKFDVVHTCGYCVDRPHHINTVHFVHSAWRKNPMHVARGQRNLNGAYQWTYSAVNAHGERRAFAQAGVVVAVSSAVRDELRDLDVPAERLRVILNGADLDEFRPAPEGTDSGAAREKVGLPVRVPLGLFAGDIRSKRKNLDTVLKALTSVPGTHLAVVGRVEGSPFPAMAQELGLADRVHFLDFRRDIADIMRACDYFVFPSRYEACALVLVEAIASGLPVITAKTTGGSEVVTADVGVQLNDPTDADAVAAAMRAFGADPARRALLSRGARSAALNHSWRGVADEYWELYNRCAGQPAGAALVPPPVSPASEAVSAASASS